MIDNIVIYQDDGVGAFGLSCLQEFFAREFPESFVRLADADTIKHGGILEQCSLFVMPGGADLPYCAKLNGQGNRNIKAFVERGGTYLGICAGAYYACRAIEYHKGHPDEISGPRELALIDAVAVGSLPELAPHYDETLESAAVVPLVSAQGILQSLYHGGCTFQTEKAERKAGLTIHALYASIESQPPAIIEQKIGLGRAVVCGVHLECDAAHLAAHPLEKFEDAHRRKHLTMTLSPHVAANHDYLANLIIGAHH